MYGEYKALDASKVGEQPQTSEALLASDVGDGFPLIMADFEGDHASGEEVGWGFP